MNEKQPERPSNVVNADSIEWVESARGDHHLVKIKQLGQAAGGEKLGCSILELPPGKISWPLHYHLANEEAIYVLSGEGLLRLGEGTVRVRAGDYIALPARSGAARQMVNDSSAPLRYLCFSTMIEPDVAFFPGTDKVMIFAGAAPGAPEERFTHICVLRGSANVDYWEGVEDTLPGSASPAPQERSGR